VSTADIRTALGSIGWTRSAAEAGRSPDRPVDAGRISGTDRWNTSEGSGRDPLLGRKSSFGWSPVRSRHGRVNAVSAACTGPGDKDTWGEGGDARRTGLACQTGEAHGTEHIPGVRVLRIQVATTEGGRKPGYAAADDPAAGRSHHGSTRADAHGRTNVSLARRQAAHLSAAETWRGEVVTFGWQPCSEAGRRSTLRRIRIRETSHQPMSSERAGKSARADRKHVTRLAVWCADGRHEPAERSIGKTLVLARVAGSVVTGHGPGRERERASPNGPSASNGRQVAKR
jgi:hypothetical protein